MIDGARIRVGFSRHDKTKALLKTRIHRGFFASLPAGLGVWQQGGWRPGRDAGCGD